VHFDEPHASRHRWQRVRARRGTLPRPWATAATFVIVAILSIAAIVRVTTTRLAPFSAPHRARAGAGVAQARGRRRRRVKFRFAMAPGCLENQRIQLFGHLDSAAVRGN
jgi:hypothetical protein